MRILTQALTSARGKVLAYILPRHMKRILFLTALYQSSIKREEVTAEELEQLNVYLKLARTNSQALRFPCDLAKERFASLNKVPLTEITDSEIQQLLKRLPSWLRYARNDDLKKDVLSLRQFAMEHA